MIEADQAFLRWWNKNHDWNWNIEGGLYERHAYDFFLAGYREKRKRYERET